jgi:signal transduction histidine kinase
MRTWPGRPIRRVDRSRIVAKESRRDGLRQPIFSARTVPWAVLAGALFFTLGTSLFVWQASRERDEARFQNAVLRTQELIDRRVQLYLVTLRGAAGLFSVLDTVRVEDFHAYVARLDVQDHFPGIQGIGWTQRLSAEPDGEGGLHERHSIEYLEPMDVRNRAAIGFDMYSEATRRAAMARARDEAVPALSGKVRLVQEIFGEEQPGFLLYVPVYQRGPTPEALEERRASLQGFVYSPFRADDLFRGIYGAEPMPGVRFRVYDGPQPDPDHLLHESPGDVSHAPHFRATATVHQVGRPWTVVYESTPAFESGTPNLGALAVLLLGLAASLWLFFLARGQARARAAAEAANQAKSSFLATMSHELRTPLNAIAGYVDLLVLEVAGELAPRQKEFLGRIDYARKHLLGLIDDVLNFAKLEAGRIEVRSRLLDMQAAMGEAESIMEGDLAAKGIEYIRSGGPPGSIWADPAKLRQILINLLGNAVKFTDAGGRITTGWEMDDAAVRIHIDDTGVGIEADQLEAIFDPFVQGDGDLTRTRYGTGLGLSISRQLARVMGGEIHVASERGQGSRFTLILPRDPRTAARRRASPVEG